MAAPPSPLTSLPQIAGHSPAGASGPHPALHGEGPGPRGVATESPDAAGHASHGGLLSTREVKGLHARMGLSLPPREVPPWGENLPPHTRKGNLLQISAASWSPGKIHSSSPSSSRLHWPARLSSREAGPLRGQHGRKHEDSPQLGLGATVPTGALFRGPWGGPHPSRLCAGVQTTRCSRGPGAVPGRPRGQPSQDSSVPGTQITTWGLRGLHPLRQLCSSDKQPAARQGSVRPERGLAGHGRLPHTLTAFAADTPAACPCPALVCGQQREGHREVSLCPDPEPSDIMCDLGRVTERVQTPQHACPTVKRGS